LDNGPEESQLLESRPNELNSIQEYIRFTHRLLYNKMKWFIKENEGKLKVKKEGNITTLGTEIPEEFNHFDKLEYNQTIFKFSNMMVMDFPLGVHSLEVIFNKEDIKGKASDANRIVFTLREKTLYKNYMRKLLLYLFLKHLQKNKDLNSKWNIEKPVYGEANFTWSMSHVDFKEIKDDIEKILKICNSMENLDLCWPKHNLDTNNSFQPVRFDGKSIKYNTHFFENLKVFLENSFHNPRIIASFTELYTWFNILKSGLRAIYGNITLPEPIFVEPKIIHDIKELIENILSRSPQNYFAFVNQFILLYNNLCVNRIYS